MKGISESEEMYLVWIARLREAGEKGPIPIGLLAERMGIHTASVNQMVHKLEEMHLVQYTPYKGVDLSQSGAEYARNILYRRRLWEVFLVEHLHLSLNEADELACRMEHLLDDQVTYRLDEYLGQPSRSPSDQIIHRPDRTAHHTGLRSLEQMEANSAGELVTLELDHPSRSFLKSEGVQPGERITVQAVSDQGNVLIQTDRGRVINLSRDLAKRIWARPETI